MEIKKCRRGEILFREGDAGTCMYSVYYGQVGIYLDYGTKSEKLVSTLGEDDFFGEMSLLDHEPRSATAVALTDDTQLEVISEQNFKEYFEENPNRVLWLLQQMIRRLRATTRDYLEACQTVYETVETEKAGQQKSTSLLDRIRKFCGMHKDRSEHARV